MNVSNKMAPTATAGTAPEGWEPMGYVSVLADGLVAEARSLDPQARVTWLAHIQAEISNADGLDREALVLALHIISQDRNRNGLTRW